MKIPDELKNKLGKPGARLAAPALIVAIIASFGGIIYGLLHLNKSWCNSCNEPVQVKKAEQGKVPSVSMDDCPACGMG